MQIIDDYLNPESYKELYDHVMSEEYKWQFTMKGIPGEFEDPTDNWQFVHPLYYDFKPVCDEAHIVGKIIRQLDPFALTRMKINCNPKSDTIKEFDLHTDEENHIGNTAIYYLNSNNGYTFFEDGTKVESKCNRILIFPGHMKHAGTTCTDKRRRVVININYVPKPTQQV